jgi:hypothetical protein
LGHFGSAVDTFDDAQVALRRVAQDSPPSIRERQVDVLNLHHRQLIETALICPEAIS